MKRIIVPGALIFLFIVLWTGSSFSQTNIINKTLISPDSNVLFIGITNSIEVFNNKNPFFEIRAARSSLTATPHPFIFEVRVSKPGWDTIAISDGSAIFFRKAFRIDFLPSPQAKLGTLLTDSATSEEITINGWLVTTIPNCKCPASFVVSSFQVEFDADGINQEAIPIEGDRLSLQAKKIIRSLKAGDVIYFDHIIAKNEEGKSIELPEFSITVKSDQ
jgi:hypothetical protein